MECKNKQFQTSLIISGILHLILIIIFLFGLPSVFEKLPEEPEAMTFEILNVSEIPNIKTQNPTNKKSEEKPQPSKEIKKSTKIDQPKVLEKELEKEVIKEKPVLPTPKKTETKKENLPDTKKQEKKETPKPQTKPVKEQEDIMEKIIKNLEEESKGDNSKSKIQNATPLAGKTFSIGAEYNEESPLSITEKMLIKNQIRKNWNIPIEAMNVNNLRIVIDMELDKNGVIRNVQYNGSICPSGLTNICNLTAESAIRAVKKTKQIENLPIERYDSWKKIKIFFDPTFY